MKQEAKKQTKEDLLKDISSRFTQLQTNRQQFHERWSEAQQFVDSKVISWETLNTIPENPKRYSSSPCNYLQTLTSGLIGYSISPNIVWFKLSLRDETLLNLYGVKDWLEEVERTMYSMMNKSNLYSSIVNFVNDGGVIGHAVLLIDEDQKESKLRYTKLPANEVYLDIDSNGKVDTVFRRYNITIRNAVKFFGLDNLDEQIQEDYKDVEKWNNLIEVMQAVYPREDFNPEYKNAENKPFACVYVDRTHSKIIQESGYDEFPFAIFEWDQFDGYAYSSSPAQKAIEDIKGLNIAKKTSWQIAQTSAEPPMKVSEDIRQVNIVPRGFTYVASADQIIEPIRTGENFPITLEVTQDMKQDIKDWFFVDFFLMLQQKAAKMTATEVMELQGEKAATLSTLIVSLNSALQTIIERSFNIAYRMGVFPEVPATLRDQHAEMKVDFVGPLAQAQKKYHTMGGTVQALNIAGPIMQMFPNAADFLDGDALMKTAMEGQGMPQNVIREDEDVMQIRQQRIQEQQAAQQQAMQQQMLQGVMQNANKLNETIQDDSIMSQLTSQNIGGLSGARA